MLDAEESAFLRKVAGDAPAVNDIRRFGTAAE
jgi:hypothetical protein